jgi:hypothetical protein
LILSATACGAGQRHAYDAVQINLPFVGSGSVSLLVVDQRASVVSKRRGADFVGLLRPDAATPEIVSTASGHPFATDVAEVVARGLTRSGYRVEALEVEPGTDEQAAFDRLRPSGASHLVLLRVEQWETETFKNTELRYDLGLEVRNAGGARLGQSAVHGSDQLTPSHDDPAGAEQAAARALEQKLNRLFAEPKVAQAFKRDL